MAEHSNREHHNREHHNREHHNSFDRAIEHLRHGASRVGHFGSPGPRHEAAVRDEDGPHVGQPRTVEETPHRVVDRSNVEDLPYDASREDEFTAELLASAVDEEDGISSPKSQSSMDTLHSSTSNLSWSSNQKNIGGMGMREVRSQEVLGPYKPEWAPGAVPVEYEDYVNDKNATKPSLNASFDRSSSTSSERSAPDPLYADLSSVSDRDFHVPDSLLKADGYDHGYDNEGKVSPNRPSHIQDHISNLKLQ